LPPKFTIRLSPGDAIQIETPGGGGYGPSEKRSVNLMRKDLLEGKYKKKDLPNVIIKK
jgi:N-methylhydantoinase B/oxoprolinase/acetone carboxylase alpha subunit